MRLDIPNILLVNPWIHDFAAYDFWAKPLGLLYIAAWLRANNWKVYIIDCLNPHHPQMPFEPGVRPAIRKHNGTGKFFRQLIPIFTKQINHVKIILSQKLKALST